jgi:DNA-binding transcriptional regulator GbsR (MarR family)
MDRGTAIFVDGMGAASATSGVLNQLQGRIFALLYLRQASLSLDEIASELDQSKSNISIQIRGLAEWHLVRRASVAGSRRDHYEAATDFWRVMQEIMERRFRWNLRQVVATIEETRRALGASDATKRGGDREAAFVAARLEALRAFVAAVDTGISAFVSGKAFAAETLQNVLRFVPGGARRSKREG